MPVSTLSLKFVLRGGAWHVKAPIVPVGADIGTRLDARRMNVYGEAMTSKGSAVASPAKLTQQDLVARSAAEIRRRSDARVTMDAGAWAYVRDDATRTELGECIVRVVRVDSPTRRTVRTMVNKEAERPVAVSALGPCLAVGDYVNVRGKTGVICGHIDDEGHGFTAAWSDSASKDDADLSIETALSEVSAGTTRQLPGSVGLQNILVTPRSPTITADLNDMLVRGCRSQSPGEDGFGPGLDAATFLRVGSIAEPARARMRGGVPICVEIASDATSSKRGGGTAVLVDLLGGATLWLWRDILINAPFKLSSFWEDEPSDLHRPRSEDIAPPNAIKMTPSEKLKAAAEARQTRTALPAASQAALPAASEDNNMDTIQKLCAAITPARDTLMLADETYMRRAGDAVEELRQRWSSNELADVNDDINLLLYSVTPGAYMVRQTRAIELPDGRLLRVVRCSPAGHTSHERIDLLVGFLSPVTSGSGNGGSLAITEGDGALAKAGKGFLRSILDGGKAAVSATGQHVVDAGKRKALAAGAVAAQGTLVAAQETVSRSAIVAVAALTGADDPQAAASNPMYRHAANEASVMGMRALGGLIGKFSPTIGQALEQGAQQLEQGIDRKQAEAVLNTAAPVLQNGLRALGQAALNRMAPALMPAPVAAPAAIEAAPEDRPAKPARTRKPKAPKADTPAPAQATPDTAASKPAAKPRKAAKSAGGAS